MRLLNFWPFNIAKKRREQEAEWAEAKAARDREWDDYFNDAHRRAMERAKINKVNKQDLRKKRQTTTSSTSTTDWDYASGGYGGGSYTSSGSSSYGCSDSSSSSGCD